jgi:hypothetical protein
MVMAERCSAAFLSLSTIAGKRGTMTFSVSSGNVAVLGLRANGAALTSIPTAVNRRRGPPVTLVTFRQSAILAYN